MGFAKRREHLDVEQFVPELRVEALAVTILLGTARLDEQRLHADPAEPMPDCFRGELRPVVRPDVLRWPTDSTGRAIVATCQNDPAASPVLPQEMRAD